MNINDIVERDIGTGDIDMDAQDSEREGRGICLLVAFCCLCGLLVAVLIGCLCMFDRLERTSEERSLRVCPSGTGVRVMREAVERDPLARFCVKAQRMVGLR